MRWTAFAMAGSGLLVVHLAVGALGGPDAAAWLPDPFIWLLLFPVLWGSAAEAVTAAWLLGLLRDLVHPDPFGLHSLMLGCAAFPARMPPPEVEASMAPWTSPTSMPPPEVLASTGPPARPSGLRTLAAMGPPARSRMGRRA